MKNDNHQCSPDQSTGGETIRKAFMFYINWFEDTADALSVEDQGVFFRTIVRYASRGELPGPEVSAVVKGMFGLIRNVIDADLCKYDKAVDKNRKRAAKSAEKRASQSKKAKKEKTVENESFQASEPILNTKDSKLDTQYTLFGEEERTKEPPERTFADKDSGPHAAPARQEQPDAALAPVAPAVPVPAPAVPAAASPAAASPAAASPAVPAPAPAVPSDWSLGAPSPAPAAEETAAAAANPSREEVEAYWRERGMKSDWQEFFSYYERREWRSVKGVRLRSWKSAAAFWEDKFCKDVLPAIRRKAKVEAQEDASRRAATLAAERARMRAEARAAFSAEADERAAKAVSPEMGKYMYNRALKLCNGDDDRAIELLKQSDADPALFARLVEGFRGET